MVNGPSLPRYGWIETFWVDGYHDFRLMVQFFVLFVPLADVAKGGDGAKSAFRGYFRLLSHLSSPL